MKGRNLSRLLALAYGLLVAGSASAVGYNLDCSDPLGRSVCVAIRKVESMAQPCVGGGCNFTGLIRQMDTATSLYLDTLAETASEQAGSFARDASDELCGLSFEGQPDTIRRLIVSANRFLEAMRELQEIAGVNDPETCEFNE